MDKNHKNRIYTYPLFLIICLFFAACAPQARFFNVDVKESGYVEIPIENRSIALFSVVSKSGLDSVMVGNVAIGLAEKIEQDRDLSKGEVRVYSTPKSEFDTAYMSSLMLNSAAHVLFFISDLNFGNYGVQKNAVTSEYDNANIILPYSVKMSVYDAMNDTMLLVKNECDTVYLQAISETVEKDMTGSVIRGYLPQISRKIGERLGSYISQQWVTQERMLISYEGSTAWETAYLLSQEFKWREAINAWMVLAESENYKRAAFAAYNIAVGCEMIEKFDLALKWIDFSLEKYKFQEAVELREHLKKLIESK